MTDQQNDHPSVVACYEFAKIAAAARGLNLFVTHQPPHLFVLMESEITLGTFTDIHDVEEFLSGAAAILNRRAEARSR
jgi:hypothetical protein